MGTSPAAAQGSGVTIRRAKRADLANVFALIQQARGAQLSQQELIQKATLFGYMMAETGGRLIGIAGMLVENSITCVRDLHAAGASVRGLATLTLLDAIEEEANSLACDALMVQVPQQSGLNVIHALLTDRSYQRKAAGELTRLQKEVAGEHFQEDSALWVKSLRK
jgi:N-acetylglutamate synthase-like GNAT family acetyltransferase